jgi:transposase-like protein
MTDVISHKRFQDEEAAYEWVEAHLWPHGPVCPRCGGMDRNTKLQGKSTRIGTYKCKDCRKPFTVKVGTIFEDSHIPMRMWLQAIALICASKKGISSNQLHRMMGITLKSAWFMSHRIREAMRAGDLAPMGGGGGIVEIDETVQGRREGAPKRKDRRHRVHTGGMAHALSNTVLSLVERGGSVHSYHVDSTSIADIMPTIRANLSHEAHVMTDAASWYKHMNAAGAYAGHDRVEHSQDEYVRFEPGKPLIHTNTVEGYFSLFKRGMRGVYQHCKEKHLHRYLAEFDFRYNARIALGVDDEQRAAKALVGAKGKRLTYRTTGGRGPGASTEAR